MVTINIGTKVSIRTGRKKRLIQEVEITKLAIFNRSEYERFN